MDNKPVLTKNERLEIIQEFMDFNLQVALVLKCRRHKARKDRRETQAEAHV